MGAFFLGMALAGEPEKPRSSMAPGFQVECLGIFCPAPRTLWMPTLGVHAGWPALIGIEGGVHFLLIGHVADYSGDSWSIATTLEPGARGMGATMGPSWQVHSRFGRASGVRLGVSGFMPWAAGDAGRAWYLGPRLEASVVVFAFRLGALREVGSGGWMPTISVGLSQ